MHYFIDIPFVIWFYKHIYQQLQTQYLGYKVMLITKNTVVLRV